MDKLRDLEREKVRERINKSRQEIQELNAELQKLINSKKGSSLQNKPNDPKDSINQPIQHFSKVLPDEAKKLKCFSSELLSEEDTFLKKRSYDKEKAREYIKLQKEKREEERKRQHTEEQVNHDLKKQKLQELHKKQLEIVTRNVQRKRERSKSRERCNVEQIRIDSFRPQKSISTETSPNLLRRKSPLKSPPRSNAVKKVPLKKLNTAFIAEPKKLSVNEERSPAGSPVLDIISEIKHLDEIKPIASISSENPLSRFRKPSINIQDIDRNERNITDNNLIRDSNPNGNKETKETQTLEQENKVPDWLQPSSLDPYPYNLINTVKRKFQTVLNSDINYKDVGIQSSFKEENLSKNVGQKQDSNIAPSKPENLKPFMSHKHSNVVIESEKQSFKDKMNEKSGSESDTSKNIPEISSESAISSKANTNKSPIPNLDVNKATSYNLISDNIKDIKLTPFKQEQSSDSNRNDLKSTQISYTQDFNDDVISQKVDRFGEINYKLNPTIITKRTNSSSGSSSETIKVSLKKNQILNKGFLKPPSSIDQSNKISKSRSMESLLSIPSTTKPSSLTKSKFTIKNSPSKISTEYNQRKHQISKSEVALNKTASPRDSIISENYSLYNQISSNGEEKYTTTFEESPSSSKSKYTPKDIKNNRVLKELNVGDNKFINKENRFTDKETDILKNLENSLNTSLVSHITDEEISSHYTDKETSFKKTKSEDSEIVTDLSGKIRSGAEIEIRTSNKLSVKNDSNQSSRKDVSSSILSRSSKTSSTLRKPILKINNETFHFQSREFEPLDSSNLPKLSYDNNFGSLYSTSLSSNKNSRNELIDDKNTKVKTLFKNNSYEKGVIPKKVHENIQICSKGDTKEIHLKFEAEVHLLNECNETLKQLVSVEKSITTQKKNGDNFNSKSVHNRDTQTSMLARNLDSSFANDLSTSMLSNLNFSRVSNFFKLDDTLAKDSSVSYSSRLWNIDQNFENTTGKASQGLTDIHLTFFDQLLQEEEMRIENLKMMLKIREQALLDRTKSELALLEIQRKHLKEKGKFEEASLVKKKQRGILLKSEEERREMQRIKQLQKANAHKRKNNLKQQRDMIKAQLSSEAMLSKMKMTTPRKRRFSGPIKVLQKAKEFEPTKNDPTANEVNQDITISDDNRAEDISINEHNLSDVKRSLLTREATLMKRRQTAEELLQRHKKLVEEEKKISELEKIVQHIIQQKSTTSTDLSKEQFVENKNYSSPKAKVDKFCKEAKQYALLYSENSQTLPIEDEKNLSCTESLLNKSLTDKNKESNTRSPTQIYTDDFDCSVLDNENMPELVDSNISSITELIEDFSRIKDEISQSRSVVENIPESVSEKTSESQEDFSVIETNKISLKPLELSVSEVDTLNCPKNSHQSEVFHPTENTNIPTSENSHSSNDLNIIENEANDEKEITNILSSAIDQIPDRTESDLKIQLNDDPISENTEKLVLEDSNCNLTDNEKLISNLQTIELDIEKSEENTECELKSPEMVQFDLINENISIDKSSTEIEENLSLKNLNDFKNDPLLSTPLVEKLIEENKLLKEKDLQNSESNSISEKLPLDTESECKITDTEDIYLDDFEMDKSSGITKNSIEESTETKEENLNSEDAKIKNLKFKENDSSIDVNDISQLLSPSTKTPKLNATRESRFTREIDNNEKNKMDSLNGDSDKTIDVRKRVSEILANVHSPRSESPKKFQEYYTTTYEEVQKEPANVFGNEAEELYKKQMAIEKEIKDIEQQQAREQYLYLREIPNKPPPPYTPPSTNYISQNNVLPANIEDITKICTYSAKVLHNAYLSKNLDTVKFSENDFKVINTIESSCASCLFIFDLSKDLAKAHYEQIVKPTGPAWLQIPKNISMISSHKPFDYPQLLKYLNDKVKEILGFEKRSVKESAIAKWSAKKKDRIDVILMKEAQAEEPGWLNWDEEELITKNELTNQIFDMLLNDTVNELQRLYLKKVVL